MARRAKYADDKLLEAVIEYSKIDQTQVIVVAELAAWASDNIEGLQGVKAYHFTRPVTITNSRTGRKEQQEKLCKKRIDEINSLRNTQAFIKRNPVLTDSNLDQFFEMTGIEQRKLLEETRRQFLHANREMHQMEVQHKVYETNLAEMQMLDKRVSELEKEVRRQYRIWDAQIKYIMKRLTKQEQKEILQQAGISEGDFDLVKYRDLMRSTEKEIFDIQRACRKYVEESQQAGEDDRDFNDEHATIDELVDDIFM